jgi:hypothetical protein
MIIAALNKIATHKEICASDMAAALMQLPSFCHSDRFVNLYLPSWLRYLDKESGLSAPASRVAEQPGVAADQMLDDEDSPSAGASASNAVPMETKSAESQQSALNDARLITCHQLI